MARARRHLDGDCLCLNCQALMLAEQSRQDHGLYQLGLMLGWAIIERDEECAQQLSAHITTALSYWPLIPKELH